jgi:hypothetical protein
MPIHLGFAGVVVLAFKFVVIAHGFSIVVKFNVANPAYIWIAFGADEFLEFVISLVVIVEGV